MEEKQILSQPKPPSSDADNLLCKNLASTDLGLIQQYSRNVLCANTFRLLYDYDCLINVSDSSAIYELNTVAIIPLSGRDEAQINWLCGVICCSHWHFSVSKIKCKPCQVARD